MLSILLFYFNTFVVMYWLLRKLWAVIFFDLSFSLGDCQQYSNILFFVHSVLEKSGRSTTAPSIYEFDCLKFYLSICSILLFRFMLKIYLVLFLACLMLSSVFETGVKLLFVHYRMSVCVLRFLS